MYIRDEFAEEVGKLKEKFAEKYGCSKSSVMILIDQDDNVTIVNTQTNGSYISSYRNWINTEV